MTDLISCPHCQSAFLMPPGDCPSCGRAVVIPASSAPAVADRVVTSRLNQTAAVGGVVLAGFLSGGVTWFVVSREMGAGLFLLSLLVAAVILWRK